MIINEKQKKTNKSSENINYMLQLKQWRKINKNMNSIFDLTQH
jgi:hypothetical protein